MGRLKELEEKFLSDFPFEQLPVEDNSSDQLNHLESKTQAELERSCLVPCVESVAEVVPCVESVAEL